MVLYNEINWGFLPWRLIVTVYSMTGFGRSSKTLDGIEVTVDIKSVNHRYFEYSSRLPRAYQFLDETIKGICKDSVTRGKIEVSVSVADNSENGISVELNESYAAAYISAMRKLAKKYKLKDDLKLSTLTSNGELFTVKKTAVDEEIITDIVCNAVKEALENFMSMRAVEGEKLAKDIISRTDTILGKVEFIESRSPETVKEYRQRLESKIKELLSDSTVEESRLLTETAIFADKIAVDEETVRLKSHISSLLSILNAGGDIGKKLDFVVQEMNRETNTIGSKAQDIEIAKTVVDIKAEIEKIREQVQNIE